MLVLLRIVCIAQLVTAALELGVAALVLFAAAVGSTESEFEFFDGPGPLIFAVGVLILVSAIGRIAAAILSWNFRAYALGIVSISVGLVSAFTCYCGPTALICFILGLVCYLQPQVRQAFAKRASGESPQRIASWLERGGADVDEDVFA